MSVYIKIKFNKTETSYEISTIEKVIGRNDICDIHVEDPLLSGLHCSIYINEKKELIIKDLDSKNGTFLNGLKKKLFNIFIGDKVKMGETFLMIDSEKTSSAFNKLLTYQGDLSKRVQSYQKIELDLSTIKKNKLKKR